jgi:hypothetical protein
MALNLYLLTFNCARSLVQPEVFAPYLFHALDVSATPPEILVLCLQEVAPLGPAFLGGSFLTPYFNAFRKVVKLASKDHEYLNVMTRNLGMTAIMVFARKDVRGNVAWLEEAGVGLGVSDMGNKGAVGVRMGYKINSTEQLQLTFISAHLAAMEDAMDQRNRDYKNIVQRLVFVPNASSKRTSQDESTEDAPLLQPDIPRKKDSESGFYSPISHLFVAGDLNYRTSSLQPTPEDAAERFPQPTKDEDDPKHFRHLLREDQLTREVEGGRTLHGLTEAPITFPPTYKYRNKDKPVILDGKEQWEWATHRWPSWCDRILMRNTDQIRVEPKTYTSLPLFAMSDHRPVALAVSVPLKAIPSSNAAAESAPFAIDPDWRGRRALARKKELVVGLAAYLTVTREGNAALLATVIGAIGGWLILRSLLMT